MNPGMIAADYVSESMNATWSKLPFFLNFAFASSVSGVRLGFAFEMNCFGA